MALKKVRAKGENEMWVLVGSCNCEPPESLHTPVSRFQLTFKLSQMAFKNIHYQLVNLGAFGGCIHTFSPGSDWKAVMDTPAERGSTCP